MSVFQPCYLSSSIPFLLPETLFSLPMPFIIVGVCSVTKSCPTLCHPIGLQHARFPCPLPSPRVCSNSCPSSQWCHPIISSSVTPFSSCLQSFRVFSNESALCNQWPKYWRFSFSISPCNEYSGLTSFRTDWFDLLAVQGILTTPLLSTPINLTSSCMCAHSVVSNYAIPWTAACQAPLSSSRGSSWSRNRTHISWHLLQWYTSSLPLSHLRIPHFLREAFSKALGQARSFFWKPFTALYTLIPDTQSMCK